MKQYAVLIEVQKPVPHFRLLGVFDSFEAAQRRAGRVKRPGLLRWGPLRGARSLMRQGEKRLETERRRLARALVVAYETLSDVKYERENAATRKRKR